MFERTGAYAVSVNKPKLHFPFRLSYNAESVNKLMPSDRPNYKFKYIYISSLFFFICVLSLALQDKIKKQQFTGSE